MLWTNKMLMEKYKDYANPSDRITRDVRHKLIFRINRGLYEDDPRANKFVLANVIYGPSYISFQAALGYYGMIPEAVYGVTSATFNKRRLKEFKNEYGYFQYRDIPEEAYPYGVIVDDDGNTAFAIASKEKALCDMLYVCQTVYTVEEMEDLIFNDLRIDDEIYESLNKKDLLFLAKKYPGVNMRVFVKYLKGAK